MQLEVNKTATMTAGDCVICKKCEVCRFYDKMVNEAPMLPMFYTFECVHADLEEDDDTEDKPAGLSALPDTLCSPNECPQCGETLIQPRGLEHYCEDCGYPDENRDSEPVAITYNQLNIQLREAGNAFVDMEPPAGYDMLSEDARSVADECMYAANAAMRTAMLRWHEDQTNL